MNVSQKRTSAAIDVLQRAHDLLVEGWMKGRYSTTLLVRRAGKIVEKRCYCAMGAIYEVAPNSSNDPPTGLLRDDSRDAARLLLAAMGRRRAFGSIFEADPGECERSVILLNDRWDRETVLELFRTAIAMAYRMSETPVVLQLTHQPQVTW